MLCVSNSYLVTQKIHLALVQRVKGAVLGDYDIMLTVCVCMCSGEKLHGYVNQVWQKCSRLSHFSPKDPISKGPVVVTCKCVVLCNSNQFCSCAVTYLAYTYCICHGATMLSFVLYRIRGIVLSQRSAAFSPFLQASFVRRHFRVRSSLDRFHLYLLLAHVVANLEVGSSILKQDCGQLVLSGGLRFICIPTSKHPCQRVQWV